MATHSSIFDARRAPIVMNLFSFSLEDNCFTMLCSFLPHNMSQSLSVCVCVCVCVCIPSLLSLPPTPRSQPSRSSRSTGFSSLCIQQLPTSYVFYIRSCTRFNATLSVHSTLFPLTVSTSPLSTSMPLVILLRRDSQRSSRQKKEVGGKASRHRSFQLNEQELA